MLALIATEGILFAYLIFSYAYLGSQGPAAHWPPTGGPPSLTIAIPATIALLASSGTAEWGKRVARKRRARHRAAGLWPDHPARAGLRRAEREGMVRQALRPFGQQLQLDLFPADRHAPDARRHAGWSR